MRKPPKALILSALACTVGCYTYAPAPARLVEPGTDVKIHLQQGQNVDLSSVTVRNVGLVEGQLTRWTNDGEAVVFSTYVQTRPGVRQQTAGELISIPEGNIAGVEAPRLDGTRTALALAAGVAAVVGIVVVIGGRGNKGGGGDGGNGNGTGGFAGVKLPVAVFR